MGIIWWIGLIFMFLLIIIGFWVAGMYIYNSIRWEIELKKFNKIEKELKKRITNG